MTYFAVAGMVVHASILFLLLVAFAFVLRIGAMYQMRQLTRRQLTSECLWVFGSVFVGMFIVFLGGAHTLNIEQRYDASLLLALTFATFMTILNLSTRRH